MQSERFMYGDEETMLHGPSPVTTVLMVGFDDRQQLMTGTRAALWREFKNGAGGPGCKGVQPVGWKYWIPQSEVGLSDVSKAIIPPYMNGKGAF